MIFSLFDYDLPFSQMVILFVAIIVVMLLSLSLHEFAHGFIAYKQGDATPKIAGRLSLNPLTHIEPLGFVMLMFVGIGWAKPMPVNPTNFKKYRSGIAKVSIAGILANLILCVVGSFLFVLSLNLSGDGNDLLVIISSWLMVINAFLFVFNLLPIYPLDGFNFISSFMRGDNKFVQNNIKYGDKIFVGILIVDLILGLMFDFSVISYILSTVAGWICTPLIKLWQLMF